MMKLIVCLALWTAVWATPIDDWISFKSVHQKKYPNLSEELRRKNIFTENKNFIDGHNEKFADGVVSFSLKMNKFGDLTNEEYRQRMNLLLNQSSPQSNKSGFMLGAAEDVPDSIDWVKRGAVTPVKDQGDCSACWAFSSTGALEGQKFRKSGELTPLSEQNLIDCSKKYENLGCFGGLMDNAFRYVSANGGIDTEDSYPYEAKDGQCRFRTSSVGASNSGYIEIPKGNEEELKKAVGTVGPVSVAVDSGEDSFRFYSGGVYYDDKCCPENLIHAVLVVGYGSEKGQDYWLIKNSWSSKWGEHGYMKLARNRKNHCGVASKALYPLV